MTAVTTSEGLKLALRTFALGVPIGITIIDVVGYIARVEGYSMQPLLNPCIRSEKPTKRDYVFLYNWPIKKNAYDSIRRGDIIALTSPRDPKQKLIKRVIALGGDTVQTKGYFSKEVEIPVGHCWVEGDNQGQSLDSNIFGPVALGLVKSKATAIVWPPSRARFIPTGEVPPGRVRRAEEINQIPTDPPSNSSGDRNKLNAQSATENS